MKSVLLKKVNLNVISHLINFDFFFFDSLSDNTPFTSFKFLNTQKNKKLLLQNINDQITNFKQFFRLLLFLKQKKEKSYLQIILPHEDNFDIYKMILPEKLSCKFDLLLSFSEQRRRHFTNKLLLLLDYPEVTSKYTFNCLTRNNFYLLQEFTNSIGFNTLGSYKLSNSLINYKRLIFIGVVIKKILYNKIKK